MPTVYVNNPTSFFNVSGKLMVKNVRFSGINALIDRLTGEEYDNVKYDALT
jgi:hypothetical protein